MRSSGRNPKKSSTKGHKRGRAQAYGKTNAKKRRRADEKLDKTIRREDRKAGDS